MIELAPRRAAARAQVRGPRHGGDRGGAARARDPARRLRPAGAAPRHQRFDDPAAGAPRRRRRRVGRRRLLRRAHLSPGQRGGGHRLRQAQRRCLVEGNRASEPFDAIIANASGCGTMVKDYGHLLKDEPEYAERAARLSELAQDICEFVGGYDLGAPKRWSSLRVAYHPACSLQHGQRVVEQPRALLIKAGFGVVERSRGAHLLRLGRHLQHSAARARDRAARPQGQEHQAREARPRRHRQHRLHHASSRASSTCRSCTRWSCSTGPTAGRCRAGWSRSRASCRTCRSRGAASKTTSTLEARGPRVQAEARPQPSPSPRRRRSRRPTLRAVSGPFDIIGDVHGCADELIALLSRLGYSRAPRRRGREAARGDDGARRPPRLLRRRLRRPRPQLARRAAHRHGDGRARAGARRHRQPRRQAPALPQGPQGEAGARPRGHGRAARSRRARRSAPSVAAFLATPADPRLARRRPPRRRPRRHQDRACSGATTRPRAPSASTATPPASSTRPACPSASTGRRLSRRGGGDLRPHARRRAGVDRATRCASTPAACSAARLTALRWPERELVSVPALQSLRRAAPRLRPPAACAPASAVPRSPPRAASGVRRAGRTPLDARRQDFVALTLTVLRQCEIRMRDDGGAHGVCAHITDPL